MTSFSVLVNGTPGDTFKSSRGLRQGDPLSPLIFILAVEVLTKMFLKVQEEGLIRSFKVSINGGGFPIIQFADGTLLLVGGEVQEAKAVKKTLIWFDASSGLRVNTEKMMIYQVGHFPDNYLGLSLGAKFRCILVWEPLLEKFRGKLAL